MKKSYKTGLETAIKRFAERLRNLEARIKDLPHKMTANGYFIFSSFISLKEYAKSLGHFNDSILTTFLRKI